NKYKITEEFAQINERFLGFHFIKSKRPVFSVDSSKTTQYFFQLDWIQDWNHCVVLFRSEFLPSLFLIKVNKQGR
ncbi:MAG: hypothetical protein E7B19_05990, partial [Streptococcus mitis]|nr:hypothetical protein [Streptococcus mitis]